MNSIKRFILVFVSLFFLMPIQSESAQFVANPSVSFDLQYDFNRNLVEQFPYVSASTVAISELTVDQAASFHSFLDTLTLPPAESTIFDLMEYQTSVKDQNPRGSCVTFAFIGAMEAAYVRKYGLNEVNQYTTGGTNWNTYHITNDCNLVCITPQCMSTCEEFDLSEEYFIHAVFSTQSSYTPAVDFDSLPSECYLSEPIYTGATGVLVATGGGIKIPKEKYAPYYGNVNASNGTAHGINDYLQLLDSSDIMNWNGVDQKYECSDHKTQLQVDAFEYDTRLIPLDARKNAMYGVTQIQLLSEAETQSTSNLETIVYNRHEVSIGLGLGGLDCGRFPGNTYHNGDPVEFHDDGNVICVEDVRLCNSPPYGAAGCEGLWEGYDDKGDYWEAGHQMLLVGYDRTNSLFLLKNSWGNILPYIWVSYNYVRTQSSGGEIVLDVSDPGLGPDNEALMLGRWDMDFDGHQGDLVIRRTRTMPTTDAPGVYTDSTANTLARIGSYYEANGRARSVNGFIDSNNDNLIFYIDFSGSAPADGPWAIDTPLTLSGQAFRAQVFNGPGNDYTHGNFSAGYTTYADKQYGLLLNRDQITLNRPTASSFTKDDWKDDYQLYYADGNEAEFNISSISSTATSNDQYPNPFYAVFARYYPVEGTARGLGANQGLVADHPSQMFFEQELEHPDLFYHTWEKEIVSGVGVFGVPAGPSGGDNSGGSCFIDALR